MLVSILIVTTGTTLFMKLKKTHQANQLMIEECFDDFGEANIVVTKENFWSSASCEK